MNGFKRVSEVKEDFYNFDKPGVSFFGKLVKVEKQQYGADKEPQTEYVFQPWTDSTLDDLQFTDKRVRGTVILERKMGAISKGMWVEIFYVRSEDKSDNKTMKHFQVFKVNPPQQREPGEEG